MKHILCLLFVFSFLTACTGSGGKVAHAPRCPETGLLRQADSIAFLNAASTPEVPVIDATGVFGAYRGSCSPSRRGGMDFVLEFDFTAERGSAGASRGTVNLPYFVALLAPGDEVISRESKVEEITLNDKGEGKETGKIRLYVPARDVRDAWKYRVVAGFELNPQQYEYNMRQINGQKPAAERPTIKIPGEKIDDTRP